jgi:cyclic 2,3-diphosphoglycerate synthase
LVVVDGEHYPPVVERALRTINASGHTVVAAVLVGGGEKLPAGGIATYGDIPVLSGGDPRDLLWDALAELAPDAVLDASDEPVLDYRRRHELASIVLYSGLAYEGAGFRFEPPARPRLCSRPSLAVIGTGKRTGKTSIAGFAARCLKGIGHHPVVVAMGRGGPERPEVLLGDRSTLEPRDLLALADSGRHAASDYVEDALLARVPTVGCYRCGGGLAGGVDFSNVAEGVAVANGLDGDFIVLEGSGSSIPPVHANVTCLVVPASVPPEYLSGYFGPYRLLLADLVVVTMCEYPFGSPSQISSITSRIQEAWRYKGKGEEAREIQVVRTVFRPTPNRSVDGTRAFVATTAPETAGESIRRHLQEVHGCRVVGLSHSLADRNKLEEELRGIGSEADVLLCEIKAAGIEVATRMALNSEVEVVYMDNSPQGIGGDDLGHAIGKAAELAAGRFERQ